VSHNVDDIELKLLKVRLARILRAAEMSICTPTTFYIPEITSGTVTFCVPSPKPEASAFVENTAYATYEPIVVKSVVVGEYPEVFFIIAFVKVNDTKLIVPGRVTVAYYWLIERK